jgi:CheY-like chemotaxis protein
VSESGFPINFSRLTLCVAVSFAHLSEVRNPISAALSACSFVSAAVNETQPLVDLESRQSVLEDVVIIESSLKYANDLLHSMLDLNRGNTEITVRLLPTDIKRDILEPVASMSHLRGKDSSFEVLIECVPDSILVSVDRLRLKQIVLNLVRNSSRYVNAGGFIRLRAKVVEEGVTHDGEKACTICISVEDSGPGVPLDKQESLFEKCQSSVGGAGIGLSLCKKMVDMMDASISLDREYQSGVPGMSGAKFDVCLQCQLIKGENDHASDGVSSTASGRSSQSSYEATPLPIELPDHATVLFVDDDNVLRKLFARSLRRICPDWTIFEACSGEIALQMCQEEGTSCFDIIFVDQFMSTVDQAMLGTDTTHRMREIGVASIICGLSANDMQDAFQAVGADFFMHKPFPCEPLALRESLSRILTGPRNTQWSSVSTAGV